MATDVKLMAIGFDTGGTEGGRTVNATFRVWPERGNNFDVLVVAPTSLDATDAVAASWKAFGALTHELALLAEKQPAAA